MFLFLFLLFLFLFLFLLFLFLLLLVASLFAFGLFLVCIAFVAVIPANCTNRIDSHAHSGNVAIHAVVFVICCFSLFFSPPVLLCQSSVVLLFRQTFFLCLPYGILFLSFLYEIVLPFLLFAHASSLLFFK